MKQIIVMVAMIALGIAIAGFIMGFAETAETLSTSAKEKINFHIVSETKVP
jgi:hypothetical protein